MKNFVIILLAVVCISACKHEPEVVPASNGTGQNQPDPDPVPNDSVSFQTEVLPILLSNCAMSGCHAQQNPQEGIRLNTYANIMNSDVVRPGNPNGSELVEMIEETDNDDRMPPPPAARLTPEQIALIRKWISEGARNTNIPRCDTTVFTFAAVNKIITTSCKGCHGAVNPSKGIALLDHASIKNETQNGKLICAIEHTGGCTPMPYMAAKLESCKITIIKKWAAAGFPQ